MQQGTSFAIHEAPQHRQYQQSARQFGRGKSPILQAICVIFDQLPAPAQSGLPRSVPELLRRTGAPLIPVWVQLKTVSASRYFQEFPFLIRGVVRPM